MNTKPFVTNPYLHSQAYPQAYPKAYSQTYSQAYPLTQTYLHPQTQAALNPLTQTYRPPQTRPQTPPQPHPHPPAPSQPPTLSQVPPHPQTQAHTYSQVHTYSQAHPQININAEKFITKVTRETRIASAIRWALTERAVNLEELVHSEPGDFRWWWMGSQLRLTRRSVFLGLPSATLQIDRHGLWYLVEI